MAGTSATDKEDIKKGTRFPPQADFNLNQNLILGSKKRRQKDETQPGRNLRKITRVDYKET